MLIGGDDYIAISLSLYAVSQSEAILRRNFGYSLLERARTTEGGAHPPGLTDEK